MTGLTYQLKQKVRNGFVKLSDLRPNSRDIAKRMLANGELYVCPKGFLKLNRDKCQLQHRMLSGDNQGVYGRG